MYIERVPNRGSKPAVLLREGWREGGKVKKRTVANLSDWPDHKVAALAAVLKGNPVVGNIDQAFDVMRSVPHGHVAAVLRVLGGGQIIDGVYRVRTGRVVDFNDHRLGGRMPRRMAMATASEWLRVELGVGCSLIPRIPKCPSATPEGSDVPTPPFVARRRVRGRQRNPHPG